MLFVLIPLAWLAIVALIFAACRAAADGDAFANAPSAPVDVPIGPRLLLLPRPAVDAAVHAERAHPPRRRPRTAHVARRRRSAAPVAR
jgi:hypothetical protein